MVLPSDSPCNNLEGSNVSGNSDGIFSHGSPKEFGGLRL